MNVIGYPIRNAISNLATLSNRTETQTVVVKCPPFCPRCHSPLERICRTYVDDDGHDIQSEILWKCKCAVGYPVPLEHEKNRQEWPTEG